jgi:StAR-related lipid transfer protein 3
MLTIRSFSKAYHVPFQITGENIYHAFDVQVKNYSIYTSLFDIVFNAVIRFVFLILFYGIIYINHWIIVAVS